MASVLVIGAPITAVLASVVNGTLPAPTVVVGQVIMAVAVVALAVVALRSRRERALVAA